MFACRLTQPACVRNQDPRTSHIYSTLQPQGHLGRMVPSTASRRASSPHSDLTPKQVRQELSKLDLRAASTAETVESLQHDRDTLKDELTTLKKALAKAEAKAVAAEQAQEGLNNDIRELKKQTKTLHDARIEDTGAFKKHISAADTSTSKLNKLWLRVEEMEKREKERSRPARGTPSKVQRPDGQAKNLTDD